MTTLFEAGEVVRLRSRCMDQHRVAHGLITKEIGGLDTPLLVVGIRPRPSKLHATMAAHPQDVMIRP